MRKIPSLQEGNIIRLFLIDGSALAYRSHFSFIQNPLVNRRGMHTGAIYGFTMTLLRLLENEKPDYIAVIFDSKEKTFRHEMYPEYKATREKMPEEMVDQIPYIRKVVEAMKIPYVAMPGFEADDIIGTYSKKAEKKEMECFLVSGDKDFLQLVNEKTKLYNLKKGGKIEISGSEGPEKKWGVSADQVIDFLALTGDASDNVPGIPGIGPKTATKLINEFGSLKKIYQNIEDVSPERIRDKLREFKSQVELSKELVSIHRDVPVPVDIEELKANSFDWPRLRALYDELDFHSLLESSPAPNAEKTSAENENYVLVDTEAKLKTLIKDLQKVETFAIDTETTSLHVAEAEIVGISFSKKEKEAFYIPISNGPLAAKSIWKHLKPLLEDQNVKKGGQNIKYDRAVLKNAGIKLEGICFDTMIESYLLNPSSRQHGLDFLTLNVLGIEKIKTEELIGKKKSEQLSMLDVDLEKISHYACEDADMTLRLHETFAPQLDHFELRKLYEDIEIPLIEVLGDMEYGGISVDPDRLSQLQKQLTKDTKSLRSKIYKIAGTEFNLNSPKQLGPILFEKLKIQQDAGVKRVKKTKTGYSTDQNTLENYRGLPIIDALFEYRNYSKLLSTYVEALPKLIHPKTKKIHTSFNQTITATGRLSSSEPNLQNIPIRTALGKQIREAFVPSQKGWKILSADYSQVELRVLAHLSEDKELLKAFKEDTDIHRHTAALILGKEDKNVSAEERARAKAVNFGVIYGMGPQRLSRETGISLSEAKDFIEEYFKTYSGVKRYLDEQIQFAKDNEYITTIMGRRRDVADINSKNPRIAANAERIATNTPIQGSAADIIKIAMINIHHEINTKDWKGRMLLQVHDELVFEVPEKELQAFRKMVKEKMEGAVKLNTVLKVDDGVGDNWAEAH